MRIFLDTADTAAIEKHFSSGLIDGITTNPTLIMKSGRNPEDVYQELIDLGIPDISMEVVGSDEIMLAEGRRLAEKFGKDQTTVKVPCTPDGLWVCKQLSRELIKVNVTLVFDAAQAILSAKAGASYVSPFVGRVDDNSFGGLCLVKDIANTYKMHGVETQILAASIRNVRDVGRAFEYGANVCTLPVKVFDKMYDHILTEKGLELFDKDYAAACKS